MLYNTQISRVLQFIAMPILPAGAVNIMLEIV